MSMVTDFDRDPSKDLTRTRLVEIGKDKPVKITCRDPFGFWVIEWHSGPTPRALSGEFTAYNYAKAALDAYLRNETMFNKVEAEAQTEEEKETLLTNSEAKKPVLKTKKNDK